MKLSEAIRNNEHQLPQIREAFFEFDDNGEIGGVCALGGALMNADIDAFMDCVDIDNAGYRVIGFNLALISEFPALSPNTHALHPVALDSDYVRSIIVNLNDTHGWTREQIANWVESIGY